MTSADVSTCCCASNRCNVSTRHECMGPCSASSIGRNAIERIRLGEKHFSKGTVRTTDQGELIWPFQPHLGRLNCIVSVVPCEVVMQHNLEAELARILRDFQRPMSPRVEGVVCHLVYDFGDARNIFRVWGGAAAKAYQMGKTIICVSSWW
mmetsp:Transcript_76784/g.124719  ORF Transcript_76784/g.124719 Transcript_76784/m.124719 type:complete len:151 (-) Transcript_76784:260-712(-)